MVNTHFSIMTLSGALFIWASRTTQKDLWKSSTSPKFCVDKERQLVGILNIHENNNKTNNVIKHINDNITNNNNNNTNLKMIEATTNWSAIDFSNE